jgi:CRISPR-associated protein Cmr2
MKYTAINIGPIIATLGMARKPRELWAASFMFSHLMKCIYEEVEKTGKRIISPAKPSKDKNKVGIYPDRIYIEGGLDAKFVLSEAIASFYLDLYGKGSRNSNNPDLDYFNLMSASCEADKESKAIAILNQKLDVMEMCKYAADKDAAQTIYKIISKKVFSSLFQIATGDDKLPIPDLETIARRQLDSIKETKMMSHHKYCCIVQADGDNVGKTVSHEGLENGNVFEISSALVDFGIKATSAIENFGGLPIYAGGDDLLFIAPVIGRDGTHIFNLLEDIENNAFKGVHDAVGKFKLKDDKCKDIEASLSFGVSMFYYKYPLYEALESARNLLFGVAKTNEKKKAIACNLRKHSGGAFNMTFSLKDGELKQMFADLINVTIDNDTVSAIAHKIRQHETLVNLALKSGNQYRLNTLFEKVLEFDEDKERYFTAVKKLMQVLFKEIGEENYSQTLYSILRIAKFIKGEDLHDD